MQLMWISESTGKIRRIPITFQKILIGIICAGLFFIGIGAVMNLIGFRIAIQQKPEIVRAMGGVVTSQEQQEIEEVYRGKLGVLNEQIEIMALELNELKKIKEKFAALATPRLVRSEMRSASNAMGGPYKLVKESTENKDLFQALDDSIEDAKNFKQYFAQTHKSWQKQVVWLDALPSSIPISGEFSVTSGFGRRVDPFTGGFAQHEGLDFSAPIGTLILASGDGMIHKAGFHKEYGNFVEIKHKDGYKTRYAHASELLVKEGQKVLRGDPVAKVGSTGRSTGPHLHYEVMKDGGFFRSDAKLNPAGMLILADIN